MANHYLAGFAVHLYLGGLFVVYSALRLDRKHGLIATLLTGLMLDASMPVPFGTSVASAQRARSRDPAIGAAALPAGRARSYGIVVAQLANLFLFIALSFLLVGANPRPAGAWLRIFVDLLASQLAILAVAPWFLTLQDRAMELVKIHPETGRRVTL